MAKPAGFNRQQEEIEYRRHKLKIAVIKAWTAVADLSKAITEYEKAQDEDGKSGE